MNPITNMKNVTKLSEQELFTSNKTSWHDQYTGSAWIFIGGLPYDLTEGDVICIFSQYGEIVNINLIRDKDTGKVKGFCFLCYEDQRSTVLAVDNLNGIKILNRIIRVDHVSDYKIPKQGKKTDEATKKLYEEGCAPKAEVPKFLNPLIQPQDVRETLADQIHADIKLPARLPIYPIKSEPVEDDLIKVEGETEIVEKNKEKKKSQRHHSNYDSTSATESDELKKKKKKIKKSKSSFGEDSDQDSTKEQNQRKKSKKQKNSKHKYDTDTEPDKRSNGKYSKKHEDQNDYIRKKGKTERYRSRSRSSDKTFSEKKYESSVDRRR